MNNARPWFFATAVALLPISASADSSMPNLKARMQTAAAASGEVNSATLVLDQQGPARSRIVATAALGGLELFDLDGKLLGSTPAGEVVSVDVGFEEPVGGISQAVIAAIDGTGNTLRLYQLKDDELAEIGARALPLGFAAEGVCLFRNPLDRALYAFVVGDGGEVDQHLLFRTAQGKLDAAQVRRINVPSPLKQCVVDQLGFVYASEETVGIWRFNANPEADVSARLIDLPRLGQISEEVGGLALYDGGAGSRWLIAADVSAGRLNVYDREKDDVYLGSVSASAADASGGIEEPGPLFASSQNLGGDFTGGMLLVADEEGQNYKALAMADLAQALKLKIGTAQDPRQSLSAPLAVVSASFETVPVRSFGDAADDPAIWANPDDPAQSLIVATDKRAGLYLYDMSGQEVQFVADGKMNNVDLRQNFELAGKPVTLVTASNRTNKSIAIYVLDGEQRKLRNVADGVQATGLEDPYGLCMYRSARSGKTYVFINSGDGPLKQWELVDAGNGKVQTTLVRDLRFETQTEGCVADDDAGSLFIGEEDVALWRLGAEPDAGDAMTAVDRVDRNPAIKDDLEGVGLYDLGDGRGYLVVSSQGNDTYAVYRREGKQEYLGSFAVISDGPRGIDGISETDGLQISSANLGPGFESGAMIAQDGRNVLPVQNQNYKYVPWSAIARVLKLEERGP